MSFNKKLTFPEPVCQIAVLWKTTVRLRFPTIRPPSKDY